MVTPISTFIDRSPSWLAPFIEAIRDVFAFPVDPRERIFIPYVLVSVILAAWVYRGARRERLESRSFLRYLFPREVWSSASAWLDVRYFFFHQPVRLLISTPLIAFFAAATYVSTLWLISGKTPLPPTDPGQMSVSMALLFALVSTLVADCAAYWMHRVQHTIPLLWEFHKVHHSLTVMHPLSNYREHPVDNAFYSIGTGVAFGMLFTLCVLLLGYLPSGATLLGASVFNVAFYAIGYNLRHSHVWLRWHPDVLNRIFGSPAHHQVHHSFHPDHIDRNFAFMFPFWDVLFGTYCLPRTNEQVRFGLGTGEEGEYSSCWRLYSLPFRRLFGTRAQGLAGRSSSSTRPDQALPREP
jgi:sterol desaturase/sphingolipid hydroxylase (fatty acid hydroxylase superfamily)